MESLALATLLVRFLGLVLIVIGLVQLVANVLDTVRDFSPGHAAYYFKSQLLRPAILVCSGALIAFLSHPLATLIADGIDR